ncbi:MAG: DNA gyrase inhibitor YacG [Planctomycetaceae bacterium]
MIRSITCPICKRKLPPGAGAESAWFPFCSERCRNVDLYRWSEGRYAIAEPLVPDEDGATGTMSDPHGDE